MEDIAMNLDVLIDVVVDDEALRVGVAGALGIDDSAVFVVDSVEDAPTPRAGTAVCERRSIGGQFPFLLAVYAYGVPSSSPEAEVTAAKRLVQALGCSCLMSDESLNPYSMLLIQPSVEPGVVAIDAGRLDEHGEYWLAAGD